MKNGKNVVIAQSGGPTPVINNSLRGIIEGCRMFPDKFGKIYAGFHGVEGILKEQLLDLSVQDEDEIQLLRTTPAAGAIGTCRYKLKKHQTEDFRRIIDVFAAHNVSYFFYIGGNDSMDTASKVAILANEKGLDLTAVGIAKTIDNDLGDSEFKLIDHSPGYGSTARYWALNIQNANEENKGSCPSDPVLVIQVMGRKIGFIPAAARLADTNREIPLQIYLPESDIKLEELRDNVNDEVVKSGRVIVVVSEGFNVGDIGEIKDSFGHTQFSASTFTAQQAVVNYLNKAGLKARGSARGQTPGTDQRHNMIYASDVDLEEAFRIGQNAVTIAVESGSGYMSTMIRKPGATYKVQYDKVPLELIANSERRFPKNWITPSKIDVTDDFIKYAKPLIGQDWVNVPLIKGIQRFTKFQKIFAEQKLHEYLPQAYKE
ncbi:diphosphate--fructose-6-phosphate 1-phosphotransferase [candidate division KSB1 bacterium]